MGRRDDRPSVVPYRLETIRAEELALTNPQTSADALAAHGGVFVQKSQMGGGSPIIRGFEANRILLVLDGVRLNNAIYREGHLQNAITVDAGMLQQAEVLFGPGSLMYGSDALGGVVHFRSKDPKLHYGPDNPQPEINFYTRFASANREKSFHTDINLPGRRWAALSSITLTDYDDLRAGSRRPAPYPEFGKRLFYADRLTDRDTVLPNPDPDRQVGTAYAQLDLMQKLRFQPNESLYFIANLQYSTSTDIPRYDRLTETLSADPSDLKFAEWYYGPQNRLLASLKARLLQPTPLYDRATLIAAYQKIDEDRFDRRLHRPWRSAQQEDVHVLSLTADFDRHFRHFGGIDLSYGLDLAHNRVRSTAGRENLLSGETDDRELTRYPGNGNRMTTLGAYFNLQKSSRDSLAVFQAGARWSFVHLFSRFRNDSIILWPPHYFDPGLELNNQNLTWASSL
ncbi:MAG: TonB-dependent receptor, partial [Bacteroidetes bacterium]